jgi:hypothetical protein
MIRPGPLAYIAYSFGRPLPASMREWVRNDLTGRAAIPRHLFRSMVPFVPVFGAAAVLPPGPLALRAACVLLALILALIYAFAFMDMNRRRRLVQHGLPEDLENVQTRKRRESTRERYERTYRQ